MQGKRWLLPASPASVPPPFAGEWPTASVINSVLLPFRSSGKEQGYSTIFAGICQPLRQLQIRSAGFSRRLTNPGPGGTLDGVKREDGEETALCRDREGRSLVEAPCGGGGDTAPERPVNGV